MIDKFNALHRRLDRRDRFVLHVTCDAATGHEFIKWQSISRADCQRLALASVSRAERERRLQCPRRASQCNKVDAFAELSDIVSRDLRSAVASVIAGPAARYRLRPQFRS
jgi:hypothetical protein